LHGVIASPPSTSDGWRVARSPPDKGGHDERLQGVTVVVAEDDPDSRDMLVEAVCRQGATCFPTYDGHQAFDAFKRQRPDVLVADIWMPDGDGFQLIRRIRALPPEQGGLIPAIAISGGANAEQAIMAGYHVVLLKPLDTDQLLTLIDDFMRGDEAGASLRAPWTLSSQTPTQITLTYAGYVRAADVRDSITALVGHLRVVPVRVTVDLRGVTGFALVGPYVAQRIVWPYRQHVAHVRIVAKPSLASIMASAGCRMLGVGCTVDGD
jgi:CheY-like chemotaxis protein